MSINVSRVKLQTATKDLKLRWDRTREHWDDAMSRDIEEKVIEPLERSVRSAVGAIDRMMEIVAKAKRDCS